MWKKAFFAGSLILGLGLFIFVIAKFGGIHKTLAIVGEVGWLGLAAYIATAAMTLVMPGLGWMILMRGEGMKIPLSTVLKANFMGFPLNFIAPTLYLGSEPLKMLYVARTHNEQKRRVLATIIVNKCQEFGGLLLVMLVAAGISVWKINFSRNSELAVIAAILILVAGFVLTLYAFLGNWKPTVKFINMLAAFGVAKRKLARLRTHAEEMEEMVRAAFTRRWKTFVAAQAVTLLSALSILMRPWIFFCFTKDHVLLPVQYLCAIYVVTNLINSLPHTPGGLGIFEGGMMGLFSLMGLGEENGAAFLVMNRAADVFLIILGTWLIVHYNMQVIARRIVKGEEKTSLSDAAEESPQRRKA